MRKGHRSKSHRAVLVFTAAALVITGIGLNATIARASQDQGETQRTACSASTKSTPACTITVGVLAWGDQGSATDAAYTMGTWPPAGNYALTYSLGSSVPVGEESNVTGTLVCKTAANSTSPVGNYAITAGSCSGMVDLADAFISLAYNYNLS